MSTAYEFLARENRRIRFPRSALIVFFVCLAFFVLLNFYTFASTARLKKDLHAAAERVEAEAVRAINETRQFMPNESEIAELEKLSVQHNQSMGGSRSAWTRLFNNLEKVLPADVVIVVIESPRLGRPVFGVDDREFRLRLAVADIDIANLVYMQFSNEKAFGSLSFTPKGPINYQGRSGLSVELIFTFNEKI